MRITSNQLRQIIREELLREDAQDLSVFDVKLSPPNNITVTNNSTKRFGTSTSIEILSDQWPKNLKIKSLKIDSFTPNVPDGSPILNVTVTIKHPIFNKDIVKKASLKNRAAMLRIANAIIDKKGYTAPETTTADGGKAQLIINGGS